MMKACTICGGAFNAKGRVLTCSPVCSLESRRKHKRNWRAANRERVRESQRKYRAANRDRVRESQRNYRAANRELISERNSNYRAANLERERERNSNYRAANLERERERNSEYNATHRKQRREYREAHREEKRQYYRNKALAYAVLKQLGAAPDDLPSRSARLTLSYHVLQQHFPGALPTTIEEQDE